MKTYKLYTAILMLISASVFASVSRNEKNALLDLYTYTNGDNWNVKWDFNQPVSTWYGVTVVDDKIVSINLASNNLVGIIPNSIQDLKYLESFNVFKNKLKGQFPSELFRIQTLKNINISFNSFTGHLPESISLATNLVTLEMFMNQFSGDLPENIGALKNLELLSLFNNNFTGKLPQGIYQLKNLKELAIQSNFFIGEISNEVVNMSNLEILSLFDNQFSGKIPTVEQMPKLTAMNLSLNKFEDFNDFSLMELKSYKTQLAINTKKEQNTLATNEVVIEKNKDIKSNSVTLTTIKE